MKDMGGENWSLPLDFLWVSQGLPRDLVLKLRDALGAGTFVETGTFMGGTTRWAAAYFSKVVTIEASAEIRRKAMDQFAGINNIEFLHGDSEALLPGVVGALHGPAIFWLDGHWSGGETAGEGKECPILGELAAIEASPYEHVVLIDDARLFMAPPPYPHKRDHWPDIQEVLAATARIRGNPRVKIIMDNIIAVPGNAARLLDDWSQDLSSKAWQVWLYNRTKKGLWELPWNWLKNRFLVRLTY
jgi:hypothetical protein